MRSKAQPDLSSLARLAQQPDGELRPLLLKVHAQTFAASPGRDAATTACFEAIALGLIPLVTDDVVATIAAILRDCANTPAQVRTALAARLRRDLLPGEDATPPIAAIPHIAGGHRAAREEIPVQLDRAAIHDLVARRDDGIDLALARNDAVTLDGRPLSLLVDRAQSRPALAVDLLRRDEPTVYDRAALYDFADDHARDAIRRDLALGLAITPVAGKTPVAVQAAENIVRLAEGGDRRRVVDAVGSALTLRSGWTCDLGDPLGCERFVLALRALDMAASDCIRVLIMVGAGTARSAPSIFRLAEVARSTARNVAAYLTDGAHPSPTQGVVRSQPRDERVSSGRVRDEVGAGLVSPIRTDLRARDRDASDLVDRRSTATTGQNRI